MKIQVLLTALVMSLLFSCDDDPVVIEGPIGPQGPQGIPGESGFAFEYSEINFTAPSFEVFLPFPSDFEVLASDMVLAYLLWEVVEVDGIPQEVWRPLPQNILTSNGLMQYNFDFSVLDTRLFMDAEFPLSSLGAIDTDDWIARIVIVPASFWNGRVSDEYPSYQEVSDYLGLSTLSQDRSLYPKRQD